MKNLKFAFLLAGVLATNAFAGVANFKMQIDTMAQLRRFGDFLLSNQGKTVTLDVDMCFDYSNTSVKAGNLNNFAGFYHPYFSQAAKFKPYCLLSDEDCKLDGELKSGAVAYVSAKTSSDMTAEFNPKVGGAIKYAETELSDLAILIPENQNKNFYLGWTKNAPITCKYENKVSANVRGSGVTNMQIKGKFIVNEVDQAERSDGGITAEISLTPAKK